MKLICQLLVIDPENRQNSGKIKDPLYYARTAIAQEIRVGRLRLNLSQTEVSLATGIRCKAISSIEISRRECSSAEYALFQRVLGLRSLEKVLDEPLTEELRQRLLMERTYSKSRSVQDGQPCQQDEPFMIVWARAKQAVKIDKLFDSSPEPTQNSV